MFSANKGKDLLAMIRNGQTMNGSQMLNLIAQLSVPSILAQLTNTLMVYIDASMVGSLGAKASASIGIVQSTTWLFGGLTSAAAMGFSVQAAHFIGANDFVKARQVFRQGIMATALFTLILTAVCLVIAGPPPAPGAGRGSRYRSRRVALFCHILYVAARISAWNTVVEHA